MEFSGDLDKIDEENCGKWTDYELASWLQVYDTETEFDRSTTEVSRWRRFARRIREEFNVKRSHIQCQKQASLIFVNDIIVINYYDIAFMGVKLETANMFNTYITCVCFFRN